MEQEQEFVDQMAKTFSEIESLLSLNGKKENEIDFKAIGAARQLAHSTWKELVDKYGANPAP